jgi:hypothetical protein
MKNHSAALVARTLFGLWLAISVAAVLLASLNHSLTTDLHSLDSVDLAYVAASAVYTLVFAVVGFVIASRARHPIGWLLIAVAIFWMLPLLSEQYGARALVVAPGSLRAPELVLMAGSAAFPLVFAPLAMILLMFPTGMLRSPRWRPVAVAVPIATLLVAIPSALWPEWEEWGLVIDNPIGLDGTEQILHAVITIGVALMFVVAIAGILSLVLRFRASHAAERQQIKWLAYFAVSEALIFAAVVAINFLLADTEAGDAWDSISWGILVSTTMLGLPLAIGMAILRYQLYDIDRIFNRTLVYGVLTGGLGALYLGLVVGLEAALRPVSGSSDLAVVTTTLVVAALFLPARRRVQEAVDRRFNRRSYDARRTIEAFSARLREQIDLDTLRYELLAVVDETMQPARASLWLRNQPEP